MKSIFKQYDVRGVYGQELTKKDAYMIGYYFVKKTNISKCKVSIDCRLSSKDLAKYMILGLKSAGCDVIYMGLNSTPVFYYSLFCDDLKTGIQITASHNPAEDNGFKFVFEGNSFDYESGLKKLEVDVHDDLYNALVKFDSMVKEYEDMDYESFILNKTIQKNYLEDYVDFMSKFLDKIIDDASILALKKLNIGVDFSSGMSSVALKKIFEKKGLVFDYYNDVLDGRFPNHLPEPPKAHDFLLDLEDEYDFFFAFDGDGDRIGVFDSKKELVLNDYIIALMIDYFSKEHKHFVCDLRASKVIFDIADKRGVKVDKLRVGRSFYQRHLTSFNCFFGAELSGHTFFKEFFNLDNPDMALFYLLKLIVLNINDLPNMFLKYKIYYKIPEMNFSVENPDSKLAELKRNYISNLDSEMDGLSFKFSDCWFNLRKSNTENKIRLNIEGKDKASVERYLEKIKVFLG